MHRFILLILPLTLWSCSGKDAITDTGDVSDTDTDTDADTDTDTDADADTDSDTDTDTGDTGDTGGDCAEVTALSPTDGSTSVAVDVVLEASFSEAVDEVLSFTLTVGVQDLGGSVTLSDDGMSATFTPTTFLATETAYTAEISVCDGVSETSTFTTLAAEIEPNVLVDRTFDVDLEQVTWIQPAPSIGALLVGFLPYTHLLFQVSEIDETAETITFQGAGGGPDSNGTLVQCSEAFAFDPADFSNNPAFTAGPIDTEILGYQVFQYTETGAFNGDGSAILDLNISTLIDLTGAGFCSFLDCVDCPDTDGDGQPDSDECLEFEVTATEALHKENLVLNPTLTTFPNCQ